MKHYPNVFLNVGYGPQGFMSYSGSKMLECMINGDEEQLESHFDKEVLDSVKASRMFI